MKHPTASEFRLLRLARRAAFGDQSPRRWPDRAYQRRRWDEAVKAVQRPLTATSLATLVGLVAHDYRAEPELRQVASLLQRWHRVEVDCPGRPAEVQQGLARSLQWDLRGRARNGGPAVRQALQARGLIGAHLVDEDFGGRVVRWRKTEDTAVTPEAREWLAKDLLPILCVMHFLAQVGDHDRDVRVFGPGGYKAWSREQATRRGEAVA